MSRRMKLALVLLTLGSALGLVVATNAWFVSVNSTPPGNISAALIRYLPESGVRSVPSLLNYSSVISGNSIDPEGVPLVLPGDRLLAGTSTDGAGTQTVRTSVARPFVPGETAGTVIYSETRNYPRADGTIATLTKTRRDLMDAPAPKDEWFENGALMVSPPTLNPTQFEIVTTSSEAVAEDAVKATTTTTTVVTTTYTPRIEGASKFVHTVTTVTIVTHEAPTFSPAADGGLWKETPVPAQRILTTETVLSVPNPKVPALANLPTRTYLIIKNLGTGKPATAQEAALPLAIGNLSTVATNVRVGINAVLTPHGSAGETLAVKGPDKNGTYYLGKNAVVSGTSYFVELLAFHPASTATYGWTKVTETVPGSSPWGLWDLTLKTTPATTAIPPLPVPTPPATPPPTPLPPVPPTKYLVADVLGVVADPSNMAGSLTDRKIFEEQFNKLYCQGVPTIRVHLSYYTRQNEFMDWTEFYSQSIDMSLFGGG